MMSLKPAEFKSRRGFIYKFHWSMLGVRAEVHLSKWVQIQRRFILLFQNRIKQTWLLGGAPVECNS